MSNTTTVQSVHPEQKSVITGPYTANKIAPTLTISVITTDTGLQFTLFCNSFTSIDYEKKMPEGLYGKKSHSLRIWKRKASQYEGLRLKEKHGALAFAEVAAITSAEDAVPGCF